MTKIILLISIFTSLLSSNFAYAAVVHAGVGTVTRYYPISGTQTYFVISAATINPAGCASGHYYSVPKTHPEFEEYRKILLTAHAAGKQVGVYLWDDKCEGPHSSVYPIYLEG